MLPGTCNSASNQDQAVPTSSVVKLGPGLGAYDAAVLLLGLGVRSMVRMHYASGWPGVEDRRALRLLAGTNLPQTLRRFRRTANRCSGRLGADGAHAVTRVCCRRQLAVDSMRLRAHASRKAVRTKSRSQQRVAELRDEVVRETDDARCALLDRNWHSTAGPARLRGAGANHLVRTNMLAGLIKFPNGAVRLGID